MSRLFVCIIFLDNARLVEGGVCTVLLDGLDSAGGEREHEGFLQFRDIYALFLEIDVFADLAGRVKLRGAGSVRVAASHD